MQRTVAMAVCLQRAVAVTTCVRSSATKIPCVHNETIPQGFRMLIRAPRVQVLGDGGSLGLNSIRRVAVPMGVRWKPWNEEPGRARSFTTAGVSQLEQGVNEVAGEVVHSNLSDPRVPVTIITGFLGSGKVCANLD